MATTTNAAADIRTEWEARLTRYAALRILFLADDQWGPLATTTRNMETAYRLARMVKPDEREKWETEYSRDYDRQEQELRRHMDTIYDPLMDAAVALLRTPAPDLAAVQVKHEVCMSELDVQNYTDTEAELFDIIKADVRRLAGVEA